MGWWASVAAMLKVGTLGFGGGSALIPLVQEELVERRKVLTATTFTQHTVVSSVTPGALPVKLGALAGMQISGALLALVMAVAVSVPGTLGTLLLLASVDAGGATVVRSVGFASVGITVFILALLLHYILTVVHQAHSRRRALGILAVSALATGGAQFVELSGRLLGREWDLTLPRLSTVQLIGLALAVIVVFALLRGNRPKRPGGGRAPALSPVIWRTTLVLVASAAAMTLLATIVAGVGSLRFLGLIVVSTLTSFGGGEAYVGVADGMFVGGGLVSSSVFYGQLVPIANAMPGPILIKLASAMGFGAGITQGPGVAWVLAAAAGIVALAACSVVAVVVMAMFERAPNSPIVRDIGRYILPVICGLLVTTSASMLNETAVIVAETDVSPALVLWAALAGVWVVYRVRHTGRVHDLLLIVTCGGLSLAALLLAG